jgi:non-heme chloroperoxidase
LSTDPGASFLASNGTASGDWGPKSAQPIVFHHGWPLSADDWDAQMLYFVERGYRVVAHDRRGHGRSSQVSDGHDMDHYRQQLAANRAQFYRDLASGPFYSYNRPGAKVSQAVIENWWRQGMMGGSKAHYDGIRAF